MKVKICGITNVADAMAACEAGADALGFIFAPEGKKRNRYIEPEEARRVIAQLPPFVQTVGVCVNETAERMAELLKVVDLLQLCGDESPEECAALGHRVIKAFRVGPGFDVTCMKAYDTPAYLLDACVPGAHGGTGMTCDWDIARRAVAQERPVVLAGGLTPENVGEAVEKIRPYGVDTSGGVEASPGIKDHDKIRRFIENARV